MNFYPHKLRARIVLACAATVLALSGCASMGASSPEVAVKQRANERWQALVKGDMQQAYSYLAPSYRAVTSFDRFQASAGKVAIWKSAEVINVNCEENRCTARVKIEAQPTVAVQFKGTITTGADETWLMEDGQWWLFQKL